MNPNLEKIKSLVVPTLKQFNVTLYHIEWVREGKEYILRILLDNSVFQVDLDTIVKISEIINPILDQTELASSPYMLEVSSAGAERPLVTPEQIQQAIGQYVYVHLKEPVEGKIEWTGDLIAYDPPRLQLKVKLKTRQLTISIDETKTNVIRLSVRF